jgi:hypothetical protein
MASSRRTGLNENISTYDSAGGKDYSVLSAWESDTDNNLVTTQVSETLECYAGAHYDTLLAESGITNSSYFRVIRPASGQGHAGIPKSDGTVVEFHSDVDYYVFRIRETYFQVQDLVLRCNRDAATSTVILSLEADQCAAVGCIVYDSTNIGAGIIDGIMVQFVSAGITCYVINCAAVGIENNGIAHSSGYASTSYLLNCTSVNNGVRGFYRTYAGNCHSINCVSEGNGTNWQGTFATKANYTDEAGVTFVNSGAYDVRLLLTDTHAIDLGQSLTAYGPYAFDDDILGNSRPNGVAWDIGFHEAIVNYSININDTASISEDINILESLCPNIYDSVGVAENLTTWTTVEISAYSGISLIESVSLSATHVTEASTYTAISVKEHVGVYVSGYLINGVISISCKSLDLNFEIEAM